MISIFDQLAPALGEGLDFETRKVNVPRLKEICAHIEESQRVQMHFFAEQAEGIRSSTLTIAANLQTHADQLTAKVNIVPNTGGD